MFVPPIMREPGCNLVEVQRVINRRAVFVPLWTTLLRRPRRNTPPWPENKIATVATRAILAFGCALNALLLIRVHPCRIHRKPGPQGQKDRPEHHEQEQVIPALQHQRGAIVQRDQQNKTDYREQGRVRYPSSKASRGAGGGQMQQQRPEPTAANEIQRPAAIPRSSQ